MQHDSSYISVVELQRLIESQVHPVILKSDDENYPYYGVGTAFIVEHANALFIISAQHILESQGSSIESLRIILKGNFYSLTFDRSAVFEKDYSPHFDLVILRIAPFQYELLQKFGVHWISLEDSLELDDQAAAQSYYVFGYSEDGRKYDYESKRISASLDAFSGSLTTSSFEGLTTIKINIANPSSLRGLSGSLIIADINGAWKFAGMALLATEESGLLSFIPAAAIRGYLDKIAYLEFKGDFLGEE